uniref:Uncharacterized protein n=1 Tax=Nelumbo nucifera TaxID=4432 RepID=A0A822ZT02_NELNU|nr:TPA_asm: hypothetical protein HUJ06_018971 [Nelumbo nucifera]
MKTLETFNVMEGNTQSKFKRVCVFCGSSSGNRKVFSDAALELGTELVNSGPFRLSTYNWSIAFFFFFFHSCFHVAFYFFL